ncbi:hypothetical protein [Collimonas arenae]|uniref:hypothetical protein n=1 Tax=Collimonas arenae TaxID=279058 RepID=UPI0012E057A1|nr:hypothetical protein [Collimonas arenae]
MTPDIFKGMLDELGWKSSDFCRQAGVGRNTPSRWLNGVVPIPAWAGRFLELTIEIKRLHEKYVVPPKIYGLAETDTEEL